MLLANAAWLSPFAQQGFAETARAFAVYGSNILFAIRSTDYFGGAAVVCTNELPYLSRDAASTVSSPRRNEAKASSS